MYRQYEEPHKLEEKLERVKEERDYAELEEKHLGNPKDKTGIYAEYKEPNTIKMTDKDEMFGSYKGHKIFYDPSPSFEYYIYTYGQKIQFFNLEGAFEYIDEQLDYKTLEKNDVSDEVKNHINNYLSEHLSNYELVLVQRKSNHPEDYYLYMVAGKNINNNTFSCWSCWNESRQTLDHGHYGLENMEEVQKIFDEYYFDYIEEMSYKAKSI